MKSFARYWQWIPALWLVLASPCALTSASGGDKTDSKVAFQTSERCLACHNGLTTPSGKDVSIGFDWRSSIMANSARDPYWQASVRREDIEHPESSAKLEDGCADCHMPIARYQAKLQGRLGEVFAHLPFDNDPKKNAAAEDGVSCSVAYKNEKKSSARAKASTAVSSWTLHSPRTIIPNTVHS